MTTIAQGERPRSSIDKKPIGIMSLHVDAVPAFERLPDEIIEQYVSGPLDCCAIAPTAVTLFGETSWPILTTAMQDSPSDRLKRLRVPGTAQHEMEECRAAGTSLRPPLDELSVVFYEPRRRAHPDERG
jgi:hypothetical protein